MIEAAYVGNRGVWWSGGSGTTAIGPLGYLNQVSPAAFAAFGLSPYTNPNDNLLLGDTLANSAVIARIGNYLPYPGYATTNTLLNALRPFPQFSTINDANSPTGQDLVRLSAGQRHPSPFARPVGAGIVHMVQGAGGYPPRSCSRSRISRFRPPTSRSCSTRTSCT